MPLSSPIARSESRSREGIPRGIVVIVVVLHVLPFATRPALIGGDEPHFALMAHSIAVSQDLDLTDEYAETAQGGMAAGRKSAGVELERHTRTVNGKEVFAHPLGLPMLAAPLVAMQQALAPGAPPDLLLGLFGLAFSLFALLRGLRVLSGIGPASLNLGLAIYFSTPLWFHSRTFFTEPYLASSVILLLVALYRRRILESSFWLGFAFLLKEPAAIWGVATLGYVAQRFGLRAALQLAAGPLIAGALFLCKNLVLYGTPIATFQPFQYGSIVRGTVGLFLDPGRGLVWFAPLLVVASCGWLARCPALRIESRWTAVATVGYFLLTASWVDWSGGSSYGPRLLVPILPLMIVPLVRLAASEWGHRARALLGASAAIGFAVHFVAALDPVDALWIEDVRLFLANHPAETMTGLALGAIGVWRSSRTASR